METPRNQVFMACSVDNFMTMPSRMEYGNSDSNVRLAQGKTSKSRKYRVQPTCFDFQPSKKEANKTIDIARIHSKLTTKRVGGQVILVARKQKHQSKENAKNLNRTTHRREGRETYRSQMESQDSQGNLLHIKSYPSDSASEEERQRTHRKFGSHKMDETFVQDNQVNELFKEVQRKMEGRKDSTRMFKRKNDCFFVNLKRRLEKQVKKIGDQREIDKLGLIIEGCQAHQHAKSMSSRRYSDRPRTAGVNLNLTDKKCQNRPASSQAAQSSRLMGHLRRKSENLLGKSVKRVSEKARISGKQRPPSGGTNRRYINSSCQTLFQYNAKTSQLAATSDKLEEIIGSCNSERDHGDVRMNMKTFEYYCKSMDEGFDRAGRKIEEVRCMEIDDE